MGQCRYCPARLSRKRDGETYRLALRSPEFNPGAPRPESRARAADWNHGYGPRPIRRPLALGDKEEPRNRHEPVEVSEEFRQLLRPEPIYRITPASFWWGREFPGGHEHIYSRL